MKAPSSGLSLLISLLDWPRTHLLTPTHLAYAHIHTPSCLPVDIRLTENEKVRKRGGWIDRDRERKRGQMDRERHMGEETLTDWERYLLRWRSLYKEEQGEEEWEKGERKGFCRCPCSVVIRYWPAALSACELVANCDGIYRLMALTSTPPGHF